MLRTPGLTQAMRQRAIGMQRPPLSSRRPEPWKQRHPQPSMQPPELWTLRLEPSTRRPAPSTSRGQAGTAAAAPSTDHPTPWIRRPRTLSPCSALSTAQRQDGTEAAAPSKDHPTSQTRRSRPATPCLALSMRLWAMSSRQQPSFGTLSSANCHTAARARAPSVRNGVPTPRREPMPGPPRSRDPRACYPTRELPPLQDRK